MNLDGKYRLIAELGQGGMAVVHLAVVQGHMGFRKLAVVKLLRSTYARDPDFVEMFLQEARLCARLSHPNIVHTYEVGVDDGRHYLAMEFLDGVSLYAATTLARKGGPFTVPMQARVLLEVLDGLKYAHELRDFDGKELKIVHRDVSPHNIFITFDGQVKVLDFGIAKAATSSVETATGVIKGKLTYMSPEQARGDLVDGRADLHAVGVMLWEAIAGRRRWPADMPQPALFSRLASGELPPDPGGLAKGLPRELDRIAMRGADPRDTERYQTAAEFQRDLEQALRLVEPVSLRDVGAMLREAFAEDRKRLHGVIEQQVQEVADGHAPKAPADLPTVRPLGRNRELIDTGEVPALPIPTSPESPEPSPDHAALTGATRRAPPKGPRSLWTAGIMAAAVFAGLGFALLEGKEGPPPTGVSFGTLRFRPRSAEAAPTAHDEPSESPALAPPTTEQTLTATLQAEAQTPRSQVARSATERRRHVAGNHGSHVEAATGDPPLAAPSTAKTTAPMEIELPAPEPNVLRHPTIKPKVQLDEENPWK